ncbi:vacuolar sorting 39 domain 2 protein, partial [Toxoplasma gondii CAST]
SPFAEESLDEPTSQVSNFFRSRVKVFLEQGDEEPSLFDCGVALSCACSPFQVDRARGHLAVSVPSSVPTRRGKNSAMTCRKVPTSSTPALRLGGLVPLPALGNPRRSVPSLSVSQFCGKAREGTSGVSADPGIRKAGPRRSACMLRALLQVLLRAWRQAAADPETASEDALTWKRSILNLLSKYGAHPDLEPSRVVRMLPDDWLLTEVADYFVASFRERLHDKLTATLQEQLSTVAYLHTYSDWARQRSSCFVITPERSCPVCTRRLGLTAFVAYPDGTCVHIQCAGDAVTLKPSQEPSAGSRQFDESSPFSVGASGHSTNFLLS